MINSITNDYISDAVDQLVGVLGIKECHPAQDLVSLLCGGEIKQCIQNISNHLGLTTNIRLIRVPKGYKPEDASKFESRQIARTDSSGSGVEGIIAQITIPSALPLFGTSSLASFPIDVRVSDNCHEQPQTFIAIIAHELSHILLQSLRFPNRSNEVYVDLVPLILGFTGVVETGRQITRTTPDGNQLVTQTTTYGYLTDEQFHFAHKKINSILEKYKHEKSEILKRLSQHRTRSQALKKILVKFKKLMNFLDKHHDKRIDAEDAKQIVRFHAPGYASSAECFINENEEFIREANDYCIGLRHYTKFALDKLHRYGEELRRLEGLLNQLMKSIEADTKILRRNVSFLCKLRTA